MVCISAGQVNITVPVPFHNLTPRSNLIFRGGGAVFAQADDPLVVKSSQYTLENQASQAGSGSGSRWRRKDGKTV